MSEFGAHWERKFRTYFVRLDRDGDGLLTEKDFDRMAYNIIKLGQFTSTWADEIKDKYAKIWETFFKPLTGGDASTCEQFLQKMKSRSKSEIESSVTQQITLIFDAVDTNKDGYIQQQEFLDYFDALGIKEYYAKEAFIGLDTNHDGLLSRDEFIKAGKGFVTLEEPNLPADIFFGSLI